MRALIDQCRELVGAAPRKPGLWEWWGYIRLRPPFWMQLSDTRTEPLLATYRRQKKFWREGQVVWGHIIQANETLFRTGRFDAPAEVVYSYDPEVDDHVDLLERVAHLLYSCKGQRVFDPQLTEIGEVLADELTRVACREIPIERTGGKQFYHSTIMVVRRHLPNRHLSRGLFPLLICRGMPFAKIVPSRFWPSDLVRWWEEE